EKRLDTHVDEPGEGARRIVRMQRAEHHVSREGRLNRTLGRLMVADFADEDHVRVVTQDAAQARGEGQADLRMHLDLADALVVILNRIFYRDDLDRLALDFIEAA